MTKSLSNKLFLKKQLYSFQMKEGTPVLQHLNVFNRILSDMLTLEVKLEEKYNFFLLLSSFPKSYDHLATIIMYENETVELKDVRQMLLNNEMMKKTDFTKEASGLIVKDQKWRLQSRGPKKDIKASTENSDCYYCKQPGHVKKTCSKYKEMLKKDGS